MTKERVTIMWFRQDLRLADNKALVEAAKEGPVLPIYIFDECGPKDFHTGKMSRAYLMNSLHKLSESLEGKLCCYAGAAESVIGSLTKSFDVQGVFASECFEPWNIAQQERVNKKSDLFIFNSNYLWHPKSVLNESGSFYKVFSAYKRKAYTIDVDKVCSSPKNLKIVSDPKGKKPEDFIKCDKEQLAVMKHWEVGEDAALKKLKSFIKSGLKGYKEGRDIPSGDHTSKLSPNLHFGEISPLQIHEAISKVSTTADTEHFLSEITWREFSVYLMYYFPNLHKDNFVAKFDRFPWTNKTAHLKAWQEGVTGCPIVDAGMRELKETGNMHNRVRMIVASYLVKNLGIHWHEGRDWFWQHLVDADLGNNSASWQWVAGCGADAAPYFRIFNPVTQGEKFDKDGAYTKKWVPELKKMPPKYLFKPHEAPDEILDYAGIVLGKDYPEPIVDLKQTRVKALNAFKRLS